VEEGKKEIDGSERQKRTREHDKIIGLGRQNSYSQKAGVKLEGKYLQLEVHGHH
jgi:hypothetical protein